MAKRSNIPGAAPASKRARTGVRLLRGVLAGLLAAALGLAGVCAMLPAQTAYDPARLYDYVYSGTKSQSVPFTTASMSDDCLLYTSPSRGSAGAVAAEALTVFVTVLVVQMVGSCLQSPSLFGLYPNPLSWVWDPAIFMLYSCLLYTSRCV